MLWQELTFCQQVCLQLWSLTSSLTRFYFVFWCCIVGSCCRVSKPKQATVSDTLSKHTHFDKKSGEFRHVFNSTGEVYYRKIWHQWLMMGEEAGLLCPHTDPQIPQHTLDGPLPPCVPFFLVHRRDTAHEIGPHEKMIAQRAKLASTFDKTLKKTGVSGLLGLAAWKTNDD